MFVYFIGKMLVNGLNVKILFKMVVFLVVETYFIPSETYSMTLNKIPVIVSSKALKPML